MVAAPSLFGRYRVTAWREHRRAGWEVVLTAPSAEEACVRARTIIGTPARGLTLRASLLFEQKASGRRGD